MPVHSAADAATGVTWPAMRVTVHPQEHFSCQRTGPFGGTPTEDTVGGVYTPGDSHGGL